MGKAIVICVFALAACWLFSVAGVSLGTTLFSIVGLPVTTGMVVFVSGGAACLWLAKR